jgi:fibronectin-binding autotransporter adhesin
VPDRIGVTWGIVYSASGYLYLEVFMFVSYPRRGQRIPILLVCLFFFVLLNAQADLEGYWSFNEGSGIAVGDSSGNANNGSFAVSSWTAGHSGDPGDNALNATSGSQAVSIPAAGFGNIGTNNAVTLSLWAYGDPALQPRTNVTTQGMNGGTRIVYTHLPWSNSIVYWDSGDRTNTNARPASDYEGSWSYWTFVKDGNTDFGGIYRNGTLLASRNDRTANLSGLTQLLLAPNYRGFMDDVAIYSHAISTDTIAAMFTGTFADGVTYTDPIVGSNSYTKASPGTATLSADNKYIGLTRIGVVSTTSGGTLVVTDSGALSSGEVRYERDGTLELGADGLSFSNYLFVPNWGGTVRTLRLDLAGTNTGTWSGNIDVRWGMGQGFVQDVGADDTLTLSGTISTGAGGGAGLTKNGVGTLIVAGNNTYTGATTINTGTFQLGSGTANGALNTSSTVVLNGGFFAVNQTDTVTQGTDFSATALAGAGAVIQAGSGTTILNANNSYSGATTVNAGNLEIRHNNALGGTAGTTTINGGKLRIYGNITTPEPIAIGATAPDGSITGTSGGGTFTGAITLEDGGTDFRGSDLKFSGGITSAANQSLALNGGRYQVNTNPIDLNGGTLTVTSAGNNAANALQINAAGNDWALARINFGGYLTLGGANYLPSDSQVQFGWHNAGSSSGTLNLNGFDQTVASISVTPFFADRAGDQNITGGGTLTVNQSTNTEYQGRFTGTTGLTKTGAGTLTLKNMSGTNTSNTGTTTISAGVLQIGDDDGVADAGSIPQGDIIVGGSTFSVRTDTYNGFALSPSITINSGGTVSADNGTKNAFNIGPVNLNGGILTSENGVGGPANDDGLGNWILNGAVTVGGSTQSTISATQTAMKTGASFNVGEVVAGDDLLVSGALINTGGGLNAVLKTGAGTMNVSGTNTYTGSTTINAGTLSVTGSIGAGAVSVNNTGTLGGTGSVAGLVTVASGGHVAAGASVGTLTLSGGMTLNDGAEIDAELTVGGSADLIDITGGTLTGSGTGGVTVNVTVTGGTPSDGTSYTLMDWSAAAESGVDLADFTIGSTSGPAAVGYRLAIVGQTLVLEVAPVRTVFRFN